MLVKLSVMPAFSSQGHYSFWCDQHLFPLVVKKERTGITYTFLLSISAFTISCYFNIVTPFVSLISWLSVELLTFEYWSKHDFCK